MKTLNTLSVVLAATTFAALAGAQTPTKTANVASATRPAITADSAARPDSSAPQATQKASLFRPQEISHIRPSDRRGVNVFEPLKSDSVPFTGFALRFGGAFTQEFQGLSHQNTSLPVLVNGVNSNALMNIGHGFNNAVANLNIDAQIAPGIRVAMTSYLSSRHHNETWVKDGYILVDDSPIDNPLLKKVMQYTTLQVGEMEVNYGDAHFRRADNGSSMFDPFVGNYILDAYTTEIGSNVYLRSNGLIAMLGATDGENHGEVQNPQAHTMAVVGKLGFDRNLADNLRVRLTGSFYADNRSASNTLYSGDRAGSPFFDVLENTTSTEANQAWSGEIHPGFSNKVNAEVVNPFIKIGGAEFFGSFETATGGSFAEKQLRTIRQYVYEGLYRFAGDKLYVGGRYNTLTGEMITNNYTEQNVNRYEVGGGWFVTPNVLAKAEWLNQKYNNFPVTDIRNGGTFHGFMVTGVVSF